MLVHKATADRNIAGYIMETARPACSRASGVGSSVRSRTHWPSPVTISPRGQGTLLIDRAVHDGVLGTGRSPVAVTLSVDSIQLTNPSDEIAGRIEYCRSNETTAELNRFPGAAALTHETPAAAIAASMSLRRRA